MRTVLLAAVLIASMTSPAWCQTATTQFSVRAQVVADCQITAQDLNFGGYNSNNAKSASTVLNLKCTPASAASVSLDGGSSGNPQARTMQGPATLGYLLYKDAAHQNPINTTDAAFQLTSSENTGQTVVYTVYGEIPAAQLVPAGQYIDTVRVTVTY